MRTLSGNEGRVAAGQPPLLQVQLGPADSSPFEVEIYVDMLRAAEAQRAGFGAVKAMRRPLPMCQSEIEPCYEQRTGELGCINPEFNELPAGSPTFRVFARLS